MKILTLRGISKTDKWVDKAPRWNLIKAIMNTGFVFLDEFSILAIPVMLVDFTIVKFMHLAVRYLLIVCVCVQGKNKHLGLFRSEARYILWDHNGGQ